MTRSAILTQQLAKQHIEAHVKNIAPTLSVKEWLAVGSVTVDQTDYMKRHYCDVSVMLSTDAIRYYRVYDDGFVEGR